MSQMIGGAGQLDYLASLSSSLSQSWKEQNNSDQDAGQSTTHSAHDQDHEHSCGKTEAKAYQELLHPQTLNPARADWVKALKQAAFACQHNGENVSISIPLSAVIMVEQCQSIQFAETIRIKTKQMSHINQPSIQSQSHKLSDDYFFGFIHNSKAPYKSIQSTLATYVLCQIGKNLDLKAQNDSSDVVPSAKKEDIINGNKGCGGQ
ncbi:hypothetical protein BY996DRAFT_6622082 [Phakopsora pachyrhizi]|nr:hypothetical protein BY996DRAFT_6622082 [Phakopsora pachyrhizi]